MLTIRDAQMDVFRRIADARFAAPLVAHVEECFPRESARLGDEGVQALVEAVTARAEEHGYRTQIEIGGYLDLVMLLGYDFADDPLLPWAGRALFDGNVEAPHDRLLALTAVALKRYEDTAGLDEEHLRAAAARLAALDERDEPDVGGAETLRDLLEWVYPERARTVDDAALALLARRAEEVCAQHRLALGASAATIGLLFALGGAGFVDDPRFPWARRILADGRDEPTRVRSLRRALAEHLADVLTPEEG